MKNNIMFRHIYMLFFDNSNNVSMCSIASRIFLMKIIKLKIENLIYLIYLLNLLDK